MVTILAFWVADFSYVVTFLPKTILFEISYFKNCAIESFCGRSKIHKVKLCDWLFPLSTKVTPQNLLNGRALLACDLHYWDTNKRTAVLRRSSLSLSSELG